MATWATSNQCPHSLPLGESISRCRSGSRCAKRCSARACRESYLVVPCGADHVGGGGAAIKRVEMFTGVACADGSPVLVQGADRIDGSRGHIAGRRDPALDPLFHGEVPGLHITANIVVVVHGEESRSQRHRHGARTVDWAESHGRQALAESGRVGVAIGSGERGGHDVGKVLPVAEVGAVVGRVVGQAVAGADDGGIGQPVGNAGARSEAVAILGDAAVLRVAGPRRKSPWCWWTARNTPGRGCRDWGTGNPPSACRRSRSACG